MMKSKSIVILVFLSLLTFTASIHKYFIGTKIRANPFLLHNYVTKSGTEGKLMSSITYEVNYMITISIILALWIFSNPVPKIKRILYPFLIITIIDIVDYFIWYKQMSYYKIPLLIFLIFLFNRNYVTFRLWKKR